MKLLVARCAVVAALVGTVLTVQAADAPACLPEPGRIVRRIDGEVSGAHTFLAELGNGWVFALRPAPHGWTLAVLDEAELDLTQLTPPWRFSPNPRELYGWHFRNADNSGPNEGEVNAPQTLRQFLISPGVSGTGGFRPPADAPADPESLLAEGSGTLVILDYGLADLRVGQQARMVYLRFSACLTWPDADAAGVTVPDVSADAPA